MTTEKLAICVLLLIQKGNSVVLVSLTALFLSVFAESEWDPIRLAAFLNLSTGVTVPVVLHSDEWFLVIGCIGSLVAFLRGLVCFPTCLTGWINSFWLSFSSVAFLVDVVNVVRFVIWDREIGATFFITRIFFEFFRSVFFLLFHLAVLISIISRFFTVVARWCGSVGVCICSVVAHTIYL